MVDKVNTHAQGVVCVLDNNILAITVCKVASVAEVHADDICLLSDILDVSDWF